MLFHIVDDDRYQTALSYIFTLLGPGGWFIFSDQLSFPRAIEISRHFHGRVKTAFGIGTNLTNDVGCEALNIVIKMTECNGQPVAKVSDSPGKTMCKDEGYLAYLRQVFGLAPPVPR